MHPVRPVLLNLNLILNLILLFALPSPLQAQTLFLPDRWQFTTGDDSAYSRPAFDDRNWKSIAVPASWESEGFPNYDGYAWYRVHFKVERKYLRTLLSIVLGKVDDIDETYLNGTRIGATGKFPPEPESAWNTVRVYPIPQGLLAADNVLAVRVYDMSGPGGIPAGPIGIYNEKDREHEFNPPPGPKKSFYRPVTANGLIAAVLDARRGMIENVYPHIFQAYDSAQFVKPFLSRLAPTLSSRPLRVEYRMNTHVLTASYPQLQVSYFAPFSTGEKVLYAVVAGPSAAVRQCSFTWEQRAAAVLVDSAFFDRGRGRAEKYFLFGFTDSLHQNAGAVTAAKQQLVQSKGALLEKEVRWMRAVIAGARIPANISGKERSVVEQSIVVLKMAQVPTQEIFPGSRGQLLASLPPGVWNIAWVRDGMYAIMSLNRLGLFREARSFLGFCLAARSGQYVRYTHTDGKDYGVGVPYQISVCRYFGKGREESDYNEQGPNIELDGFGLFLTALCDYVKRSGDDAFFQENFQRISSLVADAIIHNIDTNNIIRQDSGPWERHLPGKHFAYTSIACAAGLRDLAALAGKLGLRDADRFQKSYERIRDGIRRAMLVDGRFFKGNMEAADSTTHDYYDAATFEAFGLGVFDDKALFLSHLDVYNKALRVRGERRGFSRVNAGDSYDTAEWILLDLRFASASYRFEERNAAQQMVSWVTDQAALNFNLIPELYAVNTGFYDGAIPMAGFGAGAYILAVFDLYGQP